MHPSPLSPLTCLCFMPLVLTGCGGVSRPTGLVPQGTWGGDHVELVLDAAHGSLEFDCAHGTMQAPIPVAGDGTFTVTGTFVREHGGPIRDGASRSPSRGLLGDHRRQTHDADCCLVRCASADW